MYLTEAPVETRLLFLSDPHRVMCRASTSNLLACHWMVRFGEEVTCLVCYGSSAPKLSELLMYIDTKLWVKLRICLYLVLRLDSFRVFPCVKKVEKSREATSFSSSLPLYGFHLLPLKELEGKLTRTLE